MPKLVHLALVALVVLLPLPAMAQGVVDSKTVALPLAPADTSSPRDTLRSFTENIETAVQSFMAHAPTALVRESGNRALETFDFSQIAQRGRRSKEIESALLLKEILDRLELPPENEIPGDEDVAASDPPLTSWRVPNTRISIAKIQEGPRAGEFLFTAETVDRLEEYYARVKDLPYRQPGISATYERFKHRPGLVVPRGWGDALPDWSRSVVLGEALWQWIVTAISVLAAYLLIRSLLRWGRRWDERHASSAAYTRPGLPLALLGGIGVLFALRYLLTTVVRLLGDLGTVVSVIVWLLIFAGIGWFILLVGNRIADAINEWRDIKARSIDGQLVKIVFRLTSIIFLVLLVIYAAGFFGIPLTPVLASLGVGGLAIALAVRPTLENIIGGLTLFADKPVRIGEFCRFGSEYGTVEETGLRSTRIRRLDDTLVTVPNADFSQRELTNYTQRSQRLYQADLKLRYETTPEQLRYVMTRLQEMLLDHPKVSPDWLHVRFHGFGDYALVVAIFAYIDEPGWLEYRAIRESINLKVLDIVKEAGTGFAFPSQIAYLGRDAGLDAKNAEEAEKQVQEWRAKGPLPFREFD